MNVSIGLATGSTRDGRVFWLHLLLAFGVLVYLYSPLLDHSLNRTSYSRPHLHHHFANSALAQLAHYSPEHADSAHGEHGELDLGFICTLNLDAVLSLLLSLFMLPQSLIGPHDPLASGLDTHYLAVAATCPATLDPPPVS